MYQLVVGIQCISIVVLFVECWVVLKNWKSTAHSWLFFGCATTLVNNVGYLFELRASSGDVYYVAMQLSYLGRVWIAFALLMFIAELVKYNIPACARVAFALINVITYICLTTTKHTGLYYKTTEFSYDGQFLVFKHQNGLWHYIWDATLIVYIVYGLYIFAIMYRKEKNEMVKKRLQMVLHSMIVQSVFVVIEIFHLIPAFYMYDLTMLGFPIAAVFMFIAIFRFKLLDTKKIAREYVVDEISEGIVATDDTGRVRLYNKAAQNIFPELLYAPARVVERLREAIETGDNIEHNDRIYTPEANELVRDGVNAGMIFALVDATEHYRYLEELSEQKRIADAANKAKSSFLANMSHEIRTPLGAVLGMDEMILREAKDEQILSYAEAIQTAGHTLLSLISDVLDFSKIEEGKMEILPTQYDLAIVLDDLMNMVRERAEKKGLMLLRCVEGEIPRYLYGDEIRIKQIVTNLLVNAVKYTEKGEVKLDVGYRKNAEDEIFLRFQVSDTGIGMKEEDLERLCTPFARLEEGRNRTIEGSGLGMSIVKQLLTLMDSELMVKSVYGEGSEFSFEIKQKVVKWEQIGDRVTDLEAVAGRREAYRELFHAENAHVLVVDDNEVNLIVVQNLLKATRVQLDTAMSGKEAIARAHERQYDVIFIDHMMPEMDGIETLHGIKEETESEHTIYVALTANAISGAREFYLSKGFDDYLSKPIDGRLLEEMLKKYLPKEKVVQEETEGLKQEDESEKIRQLRTITELDVEQGILNCGSEKGYVSVVDVFHKTAKQNADAIEAYDSTGDLENYTIKVHALKSAARIIGAMELSDRAKELEMAGKAGEVDVIRQKNGSLLHAYRELDEKLGVVQDPATGNGQEVTEAIRKDAFQTIVELSGSMDYEMMENVLRDLKGYRFVPEDEERLQQIEECLLQLDWEGISEIAGAAI